MGSLIITSSFSFSLPPFFPGLHTSPFVLRYARLTASKSSAVDPAKKFMTGSPTNNWEDSSKLDVHPSQVAAFKYRYKNKQGVMEDSLPTMNSEIRNVSV